MLTIEHLWARNGYQGQGQVNASYIYTLASWRRHQMETFSALLAICVGNSPVPGDFHAQRPVTRSFHVFFDLRLNKPLSKQSCGEVGDLRRYRAHYDVIVMLPLILASGTHVSHFILIIFNPPWPPYSRGRPWTWPWPVPPSFPPPPAGPGTGHCGPGPPAPDHLHGPIGSHCPRNSSPS